MEANLGSNRRARSAPIGTRFGEWVVIGHATASGERAYRVRCFCGAEHTRHARNLERGLSTRCQACSHADNRLTQRAVAARLGLPRDHVDRLANRFYAIRSRCSERDRTGNYGARGIECRFADLESFIRHVATLDGWNDAGRQLDRIDNDGHYEPGNLRFVSASANGQNKRVNQYVTYDGTIWAAAEFHRRYCPAYRDLGTVLRKVRRGLSAQTIIDEQRDCRGPYGVRRS